MENIKINFNLYPVGTELNPLVGLHLVAIMVIWLDLAFT